MAKIACVSFSIKYFTDGGVASVGAATAVSFLSVLHFFHAGFFAEIH